MKKLVGRKHSVQPPKPLKSRPKLGTSKPVRERLSLREDPSEYKTSRTIEPEASQSPAPSYLLTKAEQGELAECEKTIRQGWQSFVEVGEALVKIRDKQLFRGRYERFEEYYRAEWQYQKSQVYRLMEAAKVVRVLSPIGENSSQKLPLPTCEAQVRSLIGLKEAEIKSIWQRATTEAKGKRITARLVQKQVRAIAPSIKKTDKPRKKHQTQGDPDRLTAIEKALDQLVGMVDQNNGKHEAAEKLKRHILRLSKFSS